MSLVNPHRERQAAIINDYISEHGPNLNYGQTQELVNLLGLGNPESIKGRIQALRRAGLLDEERPRFTFADPNGNDLAFYMCDCGKKARHKVPITIGDGLEEVLYLCDDCFKIEQEM